jgi:glutathione S-transferase
MCCHPTMLKFYYSQFSPNSRRVWVVLLEKGLEFELIEIKLDGTLNRPDLLAINPLHHIPVLEDDGFKIIESLAIIDYLEAKYPVPSMLPSNPKDLAIVRMVELVTMNELLPAVVTLSPLILGLPGGDADKIEKAKQKVSIILKLFESLLDSRPFFGSEYITIAEPVAGTVIPLLRQGGMSLNEYPKLDDWCNRIQQRPAWEKTELTPELIKELKVRMSARH